MNAPLSHYFMYTGHDSYLTGNQLSSDVPIISALNKGVGVTELDIWPNSTKDNVDVLHGRDLQAKVAEMITETLGDMLFSTGSECFGEFPSPESLKRRVIISTKPPKENYRSRMLK